MFQGYHVTIYDLGGSKSFRGIWPKYYHEVHGFIFVVDSADQARLAECSTVLRAMLDHHQVRGKPILLLANKADSELAQVNTIQRYYIFLARAPSIWHHLKFCDV